MSNKGMQGALTKELNESVTNLLGHNVKISLKCLVKLEVKPEKTETKILAFSACRLFILSAKIPSKIEQSFHYMDIVAIESKKPNHLLLSVILTPNETTKAFSFYSMDAEDGEEINLMIIQLGTAIKTIFPQVPLECIIRRIDVVPESRLQAMIEYNEAIEKKAKDCVPSAEVGAFESLSSMSPLINPCGNYSTQYACMCDYFSLPYREEVSWDVDTIYFSHNITELSLLDFEHLDSKDLVPIISALAFNGWFTKFRASGVKIVGGSSGNKVDPEVSEQIINLMKKSFTLEEIYLDNTGIKADFVNKLMLALLGNSNSNLHTIDFSHNTIEDKGIKSLCGFVAKINTGSPDSSTPNPPHKGLIHLNLSHTGLTSRGISDLAEALSLNKALPSTLTYLNLSENVFKDDANKLYNFLAQPNNIVTLDLSGTDCCLDTIFGALLRGCTQKLAHLNLSRNQFCKKSQKEITVLPSFKNFFTSTVSLKSLNLSSIRLPVEALKSMLLGLTCNEIASDVYINLSSNDFKSATNAAAVLEMVISDIRCLSGIDLSDNGFDADVASVITAISKNKSLKRLSIGKNFANIKPKHMPRVLESLVLLLQDEESSLESLSIADSKLRTDTCLIINALSNNQSLINIDITGNFMGLPGAKTLAKALQVNSKLESIFMDRNMVPTIGFIDIAYALERNFTLKHMPIPLQDITTAMKFGSPEKTEAAIAKIEELLRRNNTPHPFLRTKGIHTGTGAAHHLAYDSATYQMIDKLMVHLQDIVSNWSSAGKSSVGSFRLKKHIDSSVSSSESIDSKAEYVHRAENYLKEAINAKQLFTRLHQQFILRLPSVVDSTIAPSKPVDTKLNEFVLEFKLTLENFIQDTTALMLQCVQEQCPNVILNSEKLQHDLQRIHSNSVNSKHFPSLSFLQNCLVDQVGSVINFKMEEVLLAIANHICDRVLDEVIECLSSSHRSLTESGSLTSQRSSTPDVLRNRSGGWFDGGSSRDSSTEGNLSSSGGRSAVTNKDDGENFGMATPKLPNQKRQSLYTRRLRPQSVMDGMTTDEIPDLLPKSESTGGVNMLDPSSSNSSGDKLEHLGKSRPKRAKTRAPTRAAIVSTGKVSKKVEVLNEAGDSNEHLDDGLESFFRRPTVELIKVPYASQKPPFNRNLCNQSEKIAPEKFNFSHKSPNDEMSTSLIVDQNNGLHHGGASSILQSRMDEVTRSRSSPNLGVKKQHSQGTAPPPEIPRNDSPGAEEVANILNRVSSPIPPDQHSDLLAEMKAKGGKRSLAPTPTPPPSIAEEPVPVTTNTKSSNTSTASSASGSAFGVRLRASTFGEVLKSPSKSSLKSEDGGISHETSTKANGTKAPSTTANTASSKQRPKSVVGLLGAKFEMGSDPGVDALVEGNDTAQCSESTTTGAKEAVEGNPIDNRGQVKKTLAVFGGNKGSSSSGQEYKPISKSKFYTSSSLSTNLQSNSKSSSNN